MSFEKSAPCTRSLKPTHLLDFSKPSVKPNAAPSAKATWSYGGSTPAYSYGGNTYNSSGYLANPSRAAQIQARDAGALTNYEASRMGLTNRR
jgi:hypothetical protein